MQQLWGLRPISLCNFLNKIFTRIICNRMRDILPNLIFAEQATFFMDVKLLIIRCRDSSQLHSLRPSSQSVIYTANGSTSSITGEGSITLSKNFTLNSVLVVPLLDYNLLSVGQITSTLNCTVNFWPTFCTFQDILTHQILGYGVKRGKLYYLDLTEAVELDVHYH